MNNFYNGKKVFITGHTGFKGSWLCSALLQFGAEVMGYALEPNTEPSLFKLLKLENKMNSVIGDIKDLEILKKNVESFKPEIVFHLAAQSTVREGYREPAYTYGTNVMGTVNILESIRNCNTVKSFVNVTTDKVYKNNEWCYGYREVDPLDGYDPYSNSKSCSELVTASYKRCFLQDIAVSTVRAGNVVGGGDYAKDRIIPDCVRYVLNNEPILIRNPNSVRPYQYVLEPIGAYMEVAKSQYENSELQGVYNVGPNMENCVTTEEIVRMFCDIWKEGAEYKAAIVETNMHEANFLRLDNSKIRNILGIKPKYSIKQAIEMVVEFEKTVIQRGNINETLNNQIKQFFENK